MEKYTIGEVLRAFAGGGDYGTCRRCQRSGTLEVVEVPKPAIIRPKGWAKIPTE